MKGGFILEYIFEFFVNRRSPAASPRREIHQSRREFFEEQYNRQNGGVNTQTQFTDEYRQSSYHGRGHYNEDGQYPEGLHRSEYQRERGNYRDQGQYREQGYYNDQYHDKRQYREGQYRDQGNRMDQGQMYNNQAYRDNSAYKEIQGSRVFNGNQAPRVNDNKGFRDYSLQTNRNGHQNQAHNREDPPRRHTESSYDESYFQEQSQDPKATQNQLYQQHPSEFRQHRSSPRYSPCPFPNITVA